MKKITWGLFFTLLAVLFLKFSYVKGQEQGCRATIRNVVPGAVDVNRATLDKLCGFILRGGE